MLFTFLQSACISAWLHVCLSDSLYLSTCLPMWLSDYFVSSCVNLTGALYCINIGIAVQNAAFHTGIEN